MTADSMARIERLQKTDDADFLKSVAALTLQRLLAFEVEGWCGARHARSEAWINYRNGYRARALDTRLGTLELRIPKLREGTSFPPFLEPRKRSQRALAAVIQEAWIGGAMIRAPGRWRGLPVTAFERRQLNALRAALDAHYQARRGRPAAAPQPQASSTLVP